MKKTTITVIVSAVAAAVIFAVTYISSVSFLGAAWIVVSGILTIAIALIAVLAAGFAVASWQNYPADSRPMILFGYSLLSIFFSAILLHVVVFPDGHAARAMRFKPLTVIGVTSYFIYLFRK